MTEMLSGELARVGTVRRFWASDDKATASVVVRLPIDTSYDAGVAAAQKKFRETD